MDVNDLQNLDWFRGLLDEVAQEIDRLGGRRQEQRPMLEQELRALQDQVKGWSQTLAKPDLNSTLRAAIEVDWGRALTRQQEIEHSMAEEQFRNEHLVQVLDPQQVVERLSRLDDVLASNNPTLGNLELSLHIDRIDCYSDGRILMRTCKLGVLADCGHFLAENVEVSSEARIGESSDRVRPRRRARLRTDGHGDHRDDLKAAGYMAADPDRFAGLPDKWFWLDAFQIPDSPSSWTANNAEAVFTRRKESRLSYAKLAAEFDVTPPTIHAAIQHFESTHPGVKDEVHLKRGGQRPKKFDLASFADEARTLWLDGWSKEKLATKYGCSPPTIDKALVYAYEQASLPMPRRKAVRKTKVVEARRLLADGRGLDEIARMMKMSDVTVRAYLIESFADEGKPMPDLRRSKRGG